MASVVEMKSDHINPGQSAVNGLRKELRQRTAGNVGSGCTSPSQSSSIPPHVLQEIQRATEKGSSRGTTQMILAGDARKGVTSLNGESSEGAGSNVLLGHRSLPTSQGAPTPPLKGMKTLSGPGALGGVKKKRKPRPSKKPLTQVVSAEVNNFRDVVQTLTGYSSQSSVAASPIVSTPSVTISVEVPAVGAAEACVVRPQASRPNSNNTSSDSGEVPAVPQTPDRSPVSQEPELPTFLFQGSEGAGGLNDMMGYTSQSTWLALESAFSGVSSSSPYTAGIYQQDLRKLSISGYESSMRFLLEEADVPKESAIYQGDARFATDYSKGAGSADFLPRNLLPEEDSDGPDGIIDSWLNPDHPTSKNMYTNQTL